MELEGKSQGTIMGVHDTSPRAIYVLKSGKGPNIFLGSVCNWQKTWLEMVVKWPFVSRKFWKTVSKCESIDMYY